MSLLYATIMDQAQKDRPSERALFDGVRWGLHPFRAIIVSTWLEPDFRRLHVEVSNLPGDNFVVDLDDLIDVAGYPDEFYMELAQQAGLHYRNLPRIEPNDNFILGEN